MTRINYAGCIRGWKSMVFNRDCFFKTERLFNVGRPTDSHIHHKSGSIKEMVRDRHIVTIQH